MIEVRDLLRLASAGPEQLKRLGELACRLAALDEERATILSELAALGIPETGAPAKPFDPQTAARNDPPCEVCGTPASETLDGIWFCAEHGAEALERAVRP